MQTHHHDAFEREVARISSKLHDPHKWVEPDLADFVALQVDATLLVARALHRIAGALDHPPAQT